MGMILHPVVYWRDFRNDFWDSVYPQKIAETLLPLLALHRALRAPLSIGTSFARCVVHGKEVFSGEHRLEHAVHATLSASAVGLSILVHPTVGFIPSAVSDALIHLRKFVNAENRKEKLEELSLLVLDLLFLATFTVGSIEITVAALIFQILIDGYFLSQKGTPLEIGCQALLTAAHVRQLLPQLHLLRWKLHFKPTLTAQLKQDPKGFVYLDIPDEWVHSLLAQFNDGNIKLPDYFGNGKAGAHVSVVLGEKLTPEAQQMLAEDLGKLFSFQIAHADAVKPGGWDGVRLVHFLTLHCPALEALRTKLGLSQRMHGDHDFHVTFGIQREATSR